LKGFPFYKSTGCGNDFIIFDNREGEIPTTSEFIKKVCERKFGIGGDGVLFIEKSHRSDFKMRIFNPDGSEAELCGNGARCIASVAKRLGVCTDNPSFETGAGVLSASIAGDTVKVSLPHPTETALNLRLPIDGKNGRSLHFINTGVPHTVMLVNDVLSVDVQGLGSKIRHHPRFQPNGTNVDFVEIKDSKSIKLRTYERGVENETLACGTGAVASACITALLGHTNPPVIEVEVMGGETLKIYFVITKGKIEDLFLEGRVQILFKGVFFWGGGHRR
jgi:diaminopimelate epimerase